MKRPSKIEIKAAIAKLNEKTAFSASKSESKRAHFASTKNAERKTKGGV